MRQTLILIGAALILVGGLWILQGAGVIGGSFMSGSTPWLVIGVVCVMIGIPLVVLGIRHA